MQMDLFDDHLPAVEAREPPKLELVKPVARAAAPWMQFLYEEAGAWFTDDRLHRLVLWRHWSAPAEKRALFIMLNPSVANAESEDQTLRQCIAFAKGWGYGGVTLLNLHTLVATDPKELWGTEPEDRVASGFPMKHLGLSLSYDEIVREAITRTTGVVVAAWGVVPQGARPRVDAMKSMLQGLPRSASCLGMTAGGHPRHPCRLARTTGLEPFWRHEA